MRPETQNFARIDLPKQTLAKVVVFFSCHGGAGSTTVSTTTAAALANTGLRTCLLDMDFQFGDALGALSLKPRYPISEVLSDLNGIDNERLLRSLPRYGENLYLLSQVGHARALNACSPKRLIELMQRMRTVFDLIVIDGVRDFGDSALAVLDYADEIVFIATQEPLALRGLAARVELYRQMNFPHAHRLRLLLNGYRARRGLSPQVIAAHLSLDAPLLVRYGSGPVSRAHYKGAALFDDDPRSGVTRDICRMAEQVFGVTVATKNEPRSLWAWLPWRPR